MPSTTNSRIRIRQKIGKYRVEKRLSDGDFASVFRAEDTVMGIPVALKVVHARHVNRRLLQTLKRESATVNALSHAGILQIRDANVVDGRLLMAMPPGLESLESRLTRRVSFETARIIAEQVLAACAHAHQRKIWHGSLTAQNIILFADGSARLADFGVTAIRRQAQQKGRRKQRRSVPTGAALRRSDVCGLTELMYHIFTGQPVEEEFNWESQGLPKLRDRVPEPLISWLQQALSPAKARRFKDAAQMFRSYQSACKDAEKVMSNRARRLRFPATIAMPATGQPLRRAA